MILNEDQIALQNAARDFAQTKLLPGYQAREITKELDRELVCEMGDLGLLAVDVPEKFGGLGIDGVTTGVIIEEIASGDFNLAGVSVISSLLAAIILKHASLPIIEDWVPRMVSGEAIVGICVTEPGCGSDAANLRMTAKKKGDAYLLNGEKASISFAKSADAFLVFARTGTIEQGAAGISAFFVPRNASGIAVTPYNELGCQIKGRGSVFFDNVLIPAENILGAEGKGFTKVMSGFDYSRALIALQCIGAAQASLNETWRYIKEREAFGKTLDSFQGVTFPLADGESILAAVRQLSFHALALRDAKQPHTSEAAMVKWMGPKHSVDVIHQCLLTLGHAGYSLDHPHQQRLRDVIGLEIGDGTAGIMKLIIAREKSAA